MKARIAVLLLSLAVCCVPGQAQKANTDTPRVEHKNNSGPLTWLKSAVNPNTVFWIQGRWVPVDNVNYQGNADVGTVLCSILEHECLEFDSTTPMAHGVQTWIEEYKAVTWDHDGILATGRSLDGCTDETLKIRFSPPSVVIINSPVLPMPENCKKMNSAMDKLMGKSGWTTTGQMEQDELVPTRGLFSFQDWRPAESGESSKHVPQNKP